MTKDIVEIIDFDLKGLVQNFKDNTDLEVLELDAALKSLDLSAINRIGHNIKGSALNYGFSTLAEIGRSIERAALDKDIKKIETLIAQLKGYVLRVKIEFK